MKKLLFLLFAALAQCPAIAADEVKLIGHYTNMINSADDDPHFLSGYNFDLYVKNGVAVANLAAAIGSEEPAWATVQEVVFNPRTKKLYFRAEYSDGWESSRKIGGEGRAARTVLTFSGNVRPGKIVGIVKTRDGYCDACKPEATKVTLKKTADTYIYLRD